ncbi:MAG: ABC transporter permease [Butyricicoccus sp.]
MRWLFGFFVWHAASAAVGSEIILVSPLGVLRTLVSVVFDPGFLPTVGYSAVRIIGGFFIAMALGVVLRWVSSRFWVVETLLRPVTAIIKATPVASLSSSFCCGFERNLSVIISVLMVFPVIYTNTLEGIQSADPKLLEMAKVFRMSAAPAAVYLPCRR